VREAYLSYLWGDLVEFDLPWVVGWGRPLCVLAMSAWRDLEATRDADIPRQAGWLPMAGCAGTL